MSQSAWGKILRFIGSIALILWIIAVALLALAVCFLKAPILSLVVLINILLFFQIQDDVRKRVNSIEKILIEIKKEL